MTLLPCSTVLLKSETGGQASEASDSWLQDEYRDEPGSVIAADFYHSNALMAMDDAGIVARVHRNLCICEPGFSGAKVRHPSNADCSAAGRCQANYRKHLLGVANR